MAQGGVQKFGMKLSVAHGADDVVPATNDRSNTRSLTVDVLYIAGTGRTGTTVLEILLANNAGVTGVGEVKHIVQHGFLENRRCACGAPTDACDLWSRVRQTVGWSTSECRRLARLLSDLESHERFPMLCAGVVGRSTLERYRETNAALFNAVAARTQAQLIVDSSKYAGRALALARLFPSRVKVLHISRSPDELIRAFRKKNDGEQQPKSLAAVAAYYLYVLWCMRAVRVRLGDGFLSVTFEDLRRDPQAVLSRIETWCGQSFACARESLARGDRFNVGHIVTGNRLRREGSIAFDRGRAEPTASRGLERVVSQGLTRYRRLMGF